MIGLIDYGIGNLLSVAKAVETAGGEVELFGNPEEVSKYDGLILPGVGNFGDGMAQLRQSGFDEILRQWAEENKPLLGICLGMQLMLQSSEEAPGVSGLGIIPGEVVRFPDCDEKVPQIGWNQVMIARQHPLWRNIVSGNWFYFVHSYYVNVSDPEWCIGTTNYILDYCSVVGKGNVMATQFHPEKSQQTGLRLLGNFIELVKNTNHRK